jgi:hypothetical protein
VYRIGADQARRDTLGEGALENAAVQIRTPALANPRQSTGGVPRGFSWLSRTSSLLNNVFTNPSAPNSEFFDLRDK